MVNEQSCDHFNGVSICIVARNEEANIKRCLDSLRATHLPCEILVVDNQSTDTTLEVVREFSSENSSMNVRVIESNANNMADARTIGLKQSSFDLVAFIDADCQAQDFWLDGLVAQLIRLRMTSPSVSVVGGGQRLPESGNEFYETLRRFLNSPLSGQKTQLKERNSSKAVSHLATCNAVFVKSDLDGLAFDSEFGEVCEDVDFGWRLEQSGRRLIAVPNCDVTHFHKPSLKAWFSKVSKYSRGQIHLLAKHRTHRSPELLLPLFSCLILFSLIFIEPRLVFILLLSYLISVLIMSLRFSRNLPAKNSLVKLVLLVIGSHSSAAIGQLYGFFWVFKKMIFVRPEISPATAQPEVTSVS